MRPSYKLGRAGLTNLSVQAASLNRRELLPVDFEPMESPDVDPDLRSPNK